MAPLKGEIIRAKARRRLLALSAGLFLFAVYLFVYRGGFHSIDEVSMFAVTESLVKFGRVNTDQIAWTQWTTTQAEAQGFFGQDGHVYSKKGLALSLAQAPLYWLALNLPGLGMLQTASLLNALITALTGSLIFMFLRRLGYASPIATIGALIYGLATIAFVYAKYLFSEPLAGLLLLLAAYMLFTYRQEGGLIHVAIAGLAAGFSVMTRANNLFLLPVLGLYLLWVENERLNESKNGRPNQGGKVTTSQAGGVPAYPSALAHQALRFTRPAALKSISTFILALAVPGAILLAYNALRSGDPLQTGYDLTLFTPNLALGLYKLLFSPLRGLFIYSPVFLLSLPGWWLFRKSYPAEAWLFAGLVGVTVTLFSAWSSGEGLSWGSRFLVPVVPFWAIVLAPIIKTVFDPPATPQTQTFASRPTLYVLRAGFYILLPLSFFIQILGVTINPWVFLARIQSEFGGEFFLENTAALYDFRYSQMAGQIQAWSVQNSDLVWWQTWGFDRLAFGLSLALVCLAGWYLGHQPAASHLSPRFAFRLLLPVFITIAITYFLLTRYYHTDLQFGPPGDGYTQALTRIAAADRDAGPVLTVAQYHYHVPMNRFKAGLPLIGFAQQSWPLPETARPLLAAATRPSDTWLVTVGIPHAAPNNAVEQWLARHTHKISDEWGDHDTRLLRFTATPPGETRSLNTTLDETIRLEAAAVLNPAHPGEALPAALTFSALDQPEVDWTIFVQLLNKQGSVIAQTNSRPVGGYSRPTDWRPGQTIVSRHALLLPPDTPPGDYRLITGLFNPTTGRRAAVDSGSDFVDLGSITVDVKSDETPH